VSWCGLVARGLLVSGQVFGQVLYDPTKFVPIQSPLCVNWCRNFTP